MIVFTKDLFGTENHLAYESGYKWVDKIPDDSWSYGNRAYPFPASEWLAMYNIEIDSVIEKKYIRMAEVLGLENPPWQQLLGSKFSGNIKSLAVDIADKMKLNENKEYEKHWRMIQRFISNLEPAKADALRYSSLRAMNVDLPGFNITTGSINVVRYDRRTKTGRLRVSSGPSVLTLKSEYRTILKNCRQIDFKSMEPRLLLAFLGKEIEGDLYEKIMTDLKIKGDRSYAKVAIISSLYGSKVIPEISKYFAIEEWIYQLQADIKSDWINNYFGRPIYVKNVKGHHLLSLWLQSSAADAALIAFAKFFNQNKNLSPHWIIHDACIFSGTGDIPEYLYINDSLKLPIECTEIK
jgi:hypothetical protein